MVLKFYFMFPDWTRQHPATNGGTGNCGPFFSTLITSRLNSYRLPSRSSTLDHPKRVTVLLDNF